MRIFNKFLKTVFTGALSILFVSHFPFMDLGDASQDTLLFKSEVLKHRVHILAVPPEKRQSEDKTTFIFKTEGWRTLLLQEGITISPEEWVSALDLLKTKVFSSELFRVTNKNFRSLDLDEWKSEEKNKNLITPMIILAKFGAGADGKRIILYVMSGKSGSTLYTAEATNSTMQKAIDEAVLSLEEKVWAKEWRCQVVELADDAMIIDRGKLDGIRKGQKLIGYALSSEALKHSSLAPELLIMKYGSRKGLYIVSEGGKEYSKIVPLDDAPKLGIGAILEVPMVGFSRRKKDSRSRRVWDKLYDK